jgi:hypothetical protein
MKTLTEFPSMSLKNAAKTRQDLIAGGKTPEELAAAMGEALKIEGDKLNFLLTALETIGTKLVDLKRVVVYAVAEGEKAPEGTLHKGEHAYLVEYYPSVNAKNPKMDAKAGHDDKHKGKGRGGKGGPGQGQGRGGKRDEGRGRPPGDRPSPGPKKLA